MYASFFFSSRRRHTRFKCDWSSDVCSSDLNWVTGIGERPLTEMVPLYRDPKSLMPVTQFNMKWVEQAGLVKFDFLGLKTRSEERRVGKEGRSPWSPYH